LNAERTADPVEPWMSTDQGLLDTRLFEEEWDGFRAAWYAHRERFGISPDVAFRAGWEACKRQMIDGSR
jgi:hypothetical protein